MCYYVGIEDDIEAIEIRYGVTYHQPQYWDTKPPKPSKFVNGFSHPGMLMITNKRPDIVTVGEWGLVPDWAKDTEAFRKKANTLNAMVETLEEKPSFRNSVQNRCLVLVNAFYEYKWMDEKGKVKVAHRITLNGHKIFSIAGIYSRFSDPVSGQPLGSFSLITTQANTLMADIHNSKKRMPIVLHPDEEKLWLNGDALSHFADRTELDLFAEPTENYLRRTTDAA